jgi:alpha-1,2-mannosyltransferase
LLAAGTVAWWASTAGSHIDTAVFRHAAVMVLHGRSPYLLASDVPFVYPPAGLLVILPTAVGPSLHVATMVWLAISIAALARTTWILVGLAWPGLDAGQRRRRACWVFAVACALEPTLITLAFGQVGLVLLWLTVEGLRGQPGHPARAWIVGVAAAAKLTPAIVLVGLAAAGRWRSAAWGIVGVAGASAVAAALSPASVRDYVGGAWRLANDVNSGPDFLNHSLLGVTTLVGLPRWVGLTGAALALVLGIALTAALWRQGDELAGLSTVLVCGLLVSPVSWPHHWVAAYPALVLLLRETRTRRPGVLVLLTTAVLAQLLWVDQVALPGSRVLQPGDSWWLPAREWYVVWAVAFLGWAAAALRARPGRGDVGRLEQEARQSG